MGEIQNSFQLSARFPEVVLGGESFEDALIEVRPPQPRRIQPSSEVLAILGSDPLFGPLLDWSFRQFQIDSSVLRRVSGSGKPPQPELLLFNVIVALEWTPDQPYLESLQRAFSHASELLYDVTDGYMAFGQVVVGGRELMECADIQIFASNRFYPRTAVNGLTDLNKYQPIRLGRGLWDKLSRRTTPWDQKDVDKKQVGPQTIIHEWGHYALGLKDRYFKLDNAKFVVPVLSPVENTIMADVTVTEFSDGRFTTRPKDNKDGDDDISDWEMLRKHPAFRELGIQEHTADDRDEPLILRPAFHVVGGARGTQSTIRLRWEDAARYAMEQEHCWVYVVKGQEIVEPIGLIAQGTIEEPAAEFQLLGAEAGDYVVLVGNVGEGTAFKPLVLYAQIAVGNQPWEWLEATPQEPDQPGQKNAFPLLDVTVTGKTPLVVSEEAIRLPQYDIRVDGFDSRWRAFTFPLGTVDSAQDISGLSALEGHVMLVSTTGTTQIAIASYSVGGSPSESGFPGHPNPLPAGSAEGNAMLFFYDDTRGPIDPQTQYSGLEPSVLARHYEKFKIVTVTNPLNTAPPPGTWIPCGYAFSVTTNESFKTLAAGEMLSEGVVTVDLKPTLVLYYDDKDDKNRNEMSDELTIGRYSTDSQTWDLISAAGMEHKPRKGHLVALALNLTTARGLFAEEPQAEHYRLFRKPKAASDPA
jgi:hypothetical protein